MNFIETGIKTKQGTKMNILYNSISMTFMNRHNQSIIVGVGIMITSGQEDIALEGA